MTTLLFTKQCVGIDIAKATFVACVAKMLSDHRIIFTEKRTFDNNKTGYNQLLKWVRKHTDKNVSILYNMEATGVYYESLAYHLNTLNKDISVVLPNTASHYTKSLNVKSKTDEIDAQVLAQMGCERNLRKWSAPKELFRELKALGRLHHTLGHDKTMEINRLKQIKSGYKPLEEALKIHQSNIKRIKKQQGLIIAKMITLAKTDEKVWSKMCNLTTIYGIAIKSVLVVVSELNGFTMINNVRQLVSFCGLDVVQTQSGTSVNGKSRISKKGNSFVRGALFMPAMSATRGDNEVARNYHRLVDNGKNKKVALIATERKLLILMYTLWNSDQPYNPNYQGLKTSGFHEEEVPSSSSTRRVEKMNYKQKVVAAVRLTTTQNEHLYDHSSDVLLRQLQI